jgi:dTDP-4-dehydrorhamnose reductase
MDIADRDSVDAALALHGPWAVVNTAGYVRVDQAERDPERCFRENADGAGLLAEACAVRRIGLLSFSSDLVFDGTKGDGYIETDTPAPLNVYGQSKAVAERRIATAHPDALIVRTSAFFGPWDDVNFVSQTLCALRNGLRWRAANDTVVSPTYVPDLVDASLDLLIDGERGLWHLTNLGAMTWFDLACRAAEVAGLDPSGVVPVPLEELGLPARRPRFSALQSRRGTLLPPVGHALARYVDESGWSGETHAAETPAVKLEA